MFIFYIFAMAGRRTLVINAESRADNSKFIDFFDIAIVPLFSVLLSSG